MNGVDAPAGPALHTILTSIGIMISNYGNRYIILIASYYAPAGPALHTILASIGIMISMELSKSLYYNSVILLI